MAISFSCPNCKAHVQVGDELAGHTGQCPLCERLIVIPSNAQPAPMLLDADGNPVRMSPPVKMPPPLDLKPKSPRCDTPRKARQRALIEKKPSGPRWPWALGTVGGFTVIVLLISSVVALFAYRPREPAYHVIVIEQTRPRLGAALVGQLDGNRAFLADGVFQVRTTLRADDEFEALRNRHQKRYLVELRGNIPYVFDMDSTVLRSAIRVEDRNGNVLRDDRNPAPGNASIAFMPPFTDTYTVVVTTTQPGFGEYTLTIYEQARMKPPVR